MIPCEECIALVMCKNKTSIECETLTSYVERIWETANISDRYKGVWIEINKTLPNMRLVKFGERGFVFGKTKR
jgi:hypothetical protein